jgi:sterol desaturase/sphingolipid hydroxylase (fatty acid hydroxylase superfamily)
MDGLTAGAIAEQLVKLGSAMGHSLALYAALLVAFVLLERAGGASLARYRSRNFANDVFYTLFYQGGIYNLLIYAPLYAVAQPQLAFLQLGLLSALPTPAAFVLYWIAFDFLGYWVHRLQHRSRLLWAFHSVHHAQTRMTLLTSNRLHVVDQLIANLIAFVPGLVLGVPAAIWMPFYVFQQVLEAAQHSELDWRYGPFYRVLVSPLFHSIHHSVDPGRHHGNYGKILAVWDFLFGTAVASATRPARYGVEGMEMPESLSGQLLTPFRYLLGGEPAPEPALR